MIMNEIKMDDGKTINISEALHAIKAMCQSYAVCKGCPLISFCTVNYRLDPCVWDDADIPESITVSYLSTRHMK